MMATADRTTGVALVNGRKRFFLLAIGFNLVEPIWLND